MSFPPSGTVYYNLLYELIMTYSPFGLISSMDRVLRPVITKVRVRFPVKLEFFQVLLFVV